MYETNIRNQADYDEAKAYLASIIERRKALLAEADAKDAEAAERRRKCEAAEASKKFTTARLMEMVEAVRDLQNDAQHLRAKAEDLISDAQMVKSSMGAWNSDRIDANVRIVFSKMEEALGTSATMTVRGVRQALQDAGFTVQFLVERANVPAMVAAVKAALVTRLGGTMPAPEPKPEPQPEGIIASARAKLAKATGKTTA